MIAFPCSHCGQQLQVPADWTGQQAKCPRCGAVTALPVHETLAQTRANADCAASRAADEADFDVASIVVKGTAVPPASAAAEYDFLAAPERPHELGRLGPYRVLKVLGVGGMGVVFLAEDPHLGRRLALKAMKPALAASDSARKRFLREAQATASIKHDHIVSIYQVGEDRGVPFLAMEYLEGESLADRVHRQGVLPVPEALRIGREIATGLEAAHARGLIHRDIKPANIWLETPQGRVRILDFGLARGAEDNAQLTQSGAIVGTPAYMSPEQARAEPVDPRSDLFSLGCVLYRLCTGALPFKGKDATSTLLALALESPRPVQEGNPGVPVALDHLILRLLAKSAADRPASARIVVEALAAIERGEAPEPWQAGAYGPTLPPPAEGEAQPRSDATMSLGRSPVPAASRRRWLWAAVPLLLIVGAALLLTLVRTVGPDTASRGSDAGDMHAPAPPIEQEAVAPRKPLPPPRPVQVPLPPLPEQLNGHGAAVFAVAFSPDGKTLATASADRTIRLWDATRDFQPKQPCAGHTADEVVSVVFFPDSKTIAGVAWDAFEAMLWNADAGTVKQKLPRQAAKVRAVAISPAADALALALAMPANAVSVLDTNTWKEKYVLRGHAQGVWFVTYSPDGSLLASASNDWSVKLWDAKTGALAKTLTGHGHLVKSVAFSQDGKTLASGSADNMVRLWDVSTGVSRKTLTGHTAEVHAVGFSPDGTLLVSGSADGTIRIWDVATANTLRTLTGHTGRVFAIAISPDGKIIASGGADKTARLWRVK